jgi:hypothetical protein
VIDILAALLGRRTCPWCKVRSTTTPLDRLIDRMPHWMVRILILLDGPVARIGIPWHNKHHEDRCYEGTCWRCQAYAFQRDGDGQPICDWCATEGSTG